LDRSGPVGRAGGEREDRSQFGGQVLGHRTRNLAIGREIECEPDLDLVAIAGFGEVGRADDHSRGTLPHEHGHLGVQQCTWHPNRDQVPTEIAMVGLAALVDEDGDPGLGETLLLLEHPGDVVLGCGFVVPPGNAEEPAQTVSREELGIEGEGCREAGDWCSGVGGREPVFEHLHGLRSSMNWRRATSR
jgi:hypothetical protein